MKNRIFKSILAIFAILSASCNEEPVVANINGFTGESDYNEMVCLSGSTNNIFEITITSENGLRNVFVETGKWTPDGEVVTETIKICGAPKSYIFSYVFDVPDDATLNNTITFTFEDYTGATIVHVLSVSVTTDTAAPTIDVKAPLAPDNEFSPLEYVTFQIDVTDDKKMAQAELKCDVLSISEIFTPEVAPSQEIKINKSINIPTEGNYTFVVVAKDAQGNQASANIPVVIKIGTKPAIVNELPQIIGFAGGTMPFKFKVSTIPGNTITAIEVRIDGIGTGLSKSVTINDEVYVYDSYLDIPADADSYNNDLEIKVTATNDLSEVNTWTGTCTVCKGVYIYGNGTVVKTNKEYSLLMTQTPGTNDFQFKTYVEAAGEGFKFWSGNIDIQSSDQLRTAIPFVEWGKNDASTVSATSTTFITTPSTGYYIITFNPITLAYTVTADTGVPTTIIDTGEVWAQLNSQFYYDGTSWNQADWTLVKFESFPGAMHRFISDVKTANEGTWNQAVYGIAGQNGGEGILYGPLPSGAWIYVNNAFAAYLEYANSWPEMSKFEEKGSLPQNTKMRCVVDVYLMQVGWAPLSQYTYPATTTP